MPVPPPTQNKRRSYLHSLKVLCVAASVAMVAGCNTINQATGERQLSFISPEEELKIGSQQHPKIVAQFGGEFTQDPSLNTYIRDIGNDLAAVSELPNGTWTFTLLNSPVVNAFALPGGYVYVSRGLLALANSEAEVAGVIGHEIGHVTARHGATRMSQGQLVGAGSAILGAVISATTGISGAGQAAGLAGQAYLASYSRDQEYQADELGVRYLGRGGYNAEAQSWFLSSLAANSALTAELAGKNDKRRKFDFFASHPNTPDRAFKAQQLAVQSGTTSGRVAQNAYLKRIDGLLYGDDPKEGIVIDQEFLHPYLDLRFVMPDSLTIQNTPTAVKGVSDQRVVIFDGDSVPLSARLTHYMNSGWLHSHGVAAKNIYERTINGLEAAVGDASVKLNGKAAFARFAVIRHSDEQVYRFMQLDLGGHSSEGFRAFENVIESFRPLTRRDQKRVTVKRIKIVTVQPGDDQNHFAGQMDVKQKPLEQFRVLNSLLPGEALRPGRMVKLIVDAPFKP